MNITIHHPTIGEFTLSLTNCVARAVDGSDYEHGVLETLQATVDKQTVLLARIVEKLNLSNEELTEWLGQWNERLEKQE